MENYTYPGYLLLEWKSNKPITYTFIFKLFTNFHSVNTPVMTDPAYQGGMIAWSMKKCRAALLHGIDATQNKDANNVEGVDSKILQCN